MFLPLIFPPPKTHAAYTDTGYTVNANKYLVFSVRMKMHRDRVKRKQLLLIVLGILLASCSLSDKEMIKATELRILEEVKIADINGIKNKNKSFEASGISYARESFYLVFDNTSKVAEVDLQLQKLKFLDKKRKNIGYEGITYDRHKKAFYRIVEALDNSGRLNARLHRSDEKFDDKPNKSWLHYNLQYKNKGMEGLAWLTRQGETFLLVLCEGNDCDAGDISKTSGAGRVKVFEHQKNTWVYIASVRLPKELDFIDYSGMDINADNQLVIVSQESSSLWVGKLDDDNWQITEPGRIYRFPNNGQEEMVYCNLEGVAWVDNKNLVLVSDASKVEQPASCREKDQSIHRVSL